MKDIKIVKLNNYVKPNHNELLHQVGRYVTNGVDNSYFRYINDRYVGSPTNQAVIDSYANYILGQGLESTIPNFRKIISKSDVRLLCKDLKLQGAFALQVVYNIKGEICKLYQIDVAKIAYAKSDDISAEPVAFWYCFDWANKHKFKPEPIYAFGYTPEDVEKTTELLYVRIPSTQPLFSLPDYQSGLQYCELEEELSNFYINHTKNRFVATTLVNINQGSTGTDEAKEEAKNAIKSQLTGTSNAGSVIVSFNDNKENATTVENIPIGSDIYQEYQFLSEEAQNKILMAHKVTNPILFGIKEGTGFGNNADEMQVALKTLYRSQINPLREIIIEAFDKLFPDAEFNFKDFAELETVNENMSNLNNE